MKIFCTSSKDTYICNKIINGKTRVTDANVGRAGVLDLYKLYGESNLPSDEKLSGTAGDFNLDTDSDAEPEHVSLTRTPADQPPNASLHPTLSKACQPHHQGNPTPSLIVCHLP